MDEGYSICSHCIKVCHANHDVAYFENGPCFCDCGEKGDESCLALVKYPEDLRTITQYLLFSAPVVALPVRGNMVTAVNKAIQEAGSLENIRVWCFPNPHQRQLDFASPKLILLGPWGCGKTLFLTAEAIEKSQNGDKVLVNIISLFQVRNQ